MKPFVVICADPPWRFRDTLPGPKRGAAAHYPTMSLAELKVFQLPPLADDCTLFMWRVASMQEEALELVRAWGFIPKSELVWKKLTAKGNRWFGMGRRVRMEHEVAIIATRGRPVVRDHSVRSVFEAVVPGGRHSAKPDEFFLLVERLQSGPYVELFARQTRRGWTTYGNEIPGGVATTPRRARPTIGTEVIQ